jgi:alpha-tubulin suppressor-like RCC1 family protein
MVSATATAIAVSAGTAHSCAVLGDGQVFCWGANDQGQLGDGTTDARPLPAPVPSLTDVQQVAAGRAHTCARQRGGAIFCWGGNDAGQLGDGVTLQKTTPQMARLTCR